MCFWSERRLGLGWRARGLIGREWKIARVCIEDKKWKRLKNDFLKNYPYQSEADQAGQSIVGKEMLHHVYVKRQTRICTTWPSFPIVVV